MNTLATQAASQITSDEAMIERLATAYTACFATRGKNKGHRVPRAVSAICTQGLRSQRMNPAFISTLN